MNLNRMSTNIQRVFEHVKGDLYVEVTLYYLDAYDGEGRKIMSKFQDKKYGQVYMSYPVESMVISTTGIIPEYEFPDGRKARMVGQGYDLRGNSI